jgi:hypothetical protein
VSTTINSGFVQPALIGGAVVGVLSALPIISAGNLCCCLWVISGGVVAAYVLQLNQAAPITPGDGALAGLFAGLVGAGIYLVLSIPITMLMAPMERVIMDRVIESGDVPPEFREFLAGYRGGALRLLAGFISMLVAGAIFSTLGGVIGTAIFKKPLPPATPGTPGIIDVPSQP